MSKVVLITGATSGFGEATAERFVKEGYSVVITGRRKERLDAFKARFPYGNIFTLCFDVSDKKAVFDAIHSLPEAYKNIDVLVNNAGLALGLGRLGDVKPISAGPGLRLVGHNLYDIPRREQCP